MDIYSRLQVEKTDRGFVIEKDRKKSKPISFEQLFAIAYSLFHDGKPKAAEDAFKELSKIRGRGVRAKMMLARCKAELDQYDECEKIISSLFEDADGPVADELQTAFVYHSLGMTVDAIKELVKVVKQYPDLPTACLYLGDLFNEASDLKMAVRCWKLAVKRDRRGGAIAKIAKKQIGRINEHAKKKQLGVKKSTKKKIRKPDASRV